MGGLDLSQVIRYIIGMILFDLQNQTATLTKFAYITGSNVVRMSTEFLDTERAAAWLEANGAAWLAKITAAWEAAGKEYGSRSGWAPERNSVRGFATYCLRGTRGAQRAARKVLWDVTEAAWSELYKAAN